MHRSKNPSTDNYLGDASGRVALAENDKCTAGTKCKPTCYDGLAPVSRHLIGLVRGLVEMEGCFRKVRVLPPLLGQARMSALAQRLVVARRLVVAV